MAIWGGGALAVRGEAGCGASRAAMELVRCRGRKRPGEERACEAELGAQAVSSYGGVLACASNAQVIWGHKAGRRGVRSSCVCGAQPGRAEASVRSKQIVVVHCKFEVGVQLWSWGVRRRFALKWNMEIGLDI
ncbi:hypothetical protein Taro_015174 [Colocasia esculenta]|uniref:Uncharacterized protein n=1 Tax=Colocasia esculenta TaxID=4460 RepID=A0A843ULF5_COLES|nr:hypothetical protein [Colocasia esculenta]